MEGYCSVRNDSGRAQAECAKEERGNGRDLRGRIEDGVREDEGRMPRECEKKAHVISGEGRREAGGK